jgi:DnaJ-domain-containing protein 1
MPPANEPGQYFVRWFDGLGLITQSIVLFGVFMLLRGLLLWMKSRRQRREAEAERARRQEQWIREQQERQQQERQEQKEKQRAHERTQKRRRKRYARDGNDNQRDEPREGGQDGAAQRQTNEESPRPWWQVLGIPEESTLDDVKLAYYTKVKQYHPDKVTGLGEEFQKLADDKTKEINEAFERAKRALR